MKYKINYSLLACDIHDGESDIMYNYYDKKKYLIYDTKFTKIEKARFKDELRKKTLEVFDNVPVSVWYDSLNDFEFSNQNTPYEVYQNCVLNLMSHKPSCTHYHNGKIIDKVDWCTCFIIDECKKENEFRTLEQRKRIKYIMV